MSEKNICKGSFRRGTACAIIEGDNACSRCVEKNYTPEKKALAIEESKAHDATLPADRVKPKNQVTVKGEISQQ